MKQGMCVALHGGDHKVGVTMLAQCLAEHMVEHLEEMTVIQTGLQGNPGGDYCTAVVRTIEEMKSYLEQNLLHPQELLRDCKIPLLFDIPQWLFSGSPWQTADSLLPDTAGRMSL